MSAQSRQEPTSVTESVGSWPVNGPPFTVHTVAKSTISEFGVVEFPQRASQGRVVWFLLEAEIVVEPTRPLPSAGTQAFLTISVGQAAAVIVEMTAKDDSLEWTTFDLVHGRDKATRRGSQYGTFCKLRRWNPGRGSSNFASISFRVGWLTR